MEFFRIVVSHHGTIHRLDLVSNGAQNILQLDNSFSICSAGLSTSFRSQYQSQIKILINVFNTLRIKVIENNNQFVVCAVIV